MRIVLAVMLCSGCFGSLDANGRPAVIPKLSELPAEPQKRDTVLDQTQQTAGAEQRKGMTKKERKAETFAALGAAILGQMFSKTENVTLGGGGTVDENKLIDRKAKAKPRGQNENENDSKDGEADPKKPPQPQPPAENLTPWIKLR